MSVLHGKDQVGADDQAEFVSMIAWLRDKEKGPGLSWHQIVVGSKLNGVIGEHGNPPQVLQDLTRSRAIRRELFDVIRVFHEKQQTLAQNGQFGQVVQKESGGTPDPIEPYARRVQRFFVEQETPHAVPLAETLRGVTGSREPVRTGIQMALDRGWIQVVKGKWPPVRGHKTYLGPPGENIAIPAQTRGRARPKKVEPSPQKPATPTTAQLSTARDHVQAAVQLLGDLTKQPMPNIPSPLRELIEEHYREAARRLTEVLDTLRED